MPQVHLVTLAAGEESREDAIVLSSFPCVVGRHSGCDHRLRDPSVSRRHCAFRLRNGQVWVEDLGSLNGARLNGEPLTVARPLADGDHLELADLAFRVRVSGGPAEAVLPELPLGGATENVQATGDDVAGAETLPSPDRAPSTVWSSTL
jgi:pSer/pThr/pTyr-binding forkhead associated (FHA) protein